MTNNSGHFPPSSLKQPTACAPSEAWHCPCTLAPVALLSVSLARYHHVSLNKTNTADQGKSSSTGTAGVIDNDDSQRNHKGISQADLFFTMYLRPKVCAEVIISGRMPMAQLCTVCSGMVH